MFDFQGSRVAGPRDALSGTFECDCGQEVQIPIGNRSTIRCDACKRVYGILVHANGIEVIPADRTDSKRSMTRLPYALPSRASDEEREQGRASASRGLPAGTSLPPSATYGEDDRTESSSWDEGHLFPEELRPRPKALPATTEVAEEAIEAAKNALNMAQRALKLLKGGAKQARKKSR